MQEKIELIEGLMDKTTGGWVVFIVALGMMSGLLANDVAKLTQWNQALSPSFVAVVMAHFGTVVVAFIGGKLIPESRNGQRTRVTDVTPVVIVKAKEDV